LSDERVHIRLYSAYRLFPNFDRPDRVLKTLLPGTPGHLLRAAISDFFLFQSGLQAGILGAKSRFSPAVEIEYIVLATVCQH
jgi:hypothetical protein